MSIFLNKTILAGNLTADPEVQQTTTGVPVVRFSLAVRRKYVKDGEPPVTDFHRCVAWRATAEFICKYFGKGQAILVCGELQTRSWEDKHGNKRYATEVVVDEAMFVDSKNNGQGTQQQSAYAPPAPFVAEPNDDLPF